MSSFTTARIACGTASDVNWMLFEVLPRVQPGVWVHIHDLSLAPGLPPRWIFDEGLSWNEQYFVQPSSCTTANSA